MVGKLGFYDRYYGFNFKDEKPRKFLCKHPKQQER